MYREHHLILNLNLNLTLMYTDFTQMPVWKKAMDVAVSVYDLSDLLPKREDYVLTSQIRRSAESIQQILQKVMEGVVIKINADSINIREAQPTRQRIT